MKLLTTIEPQAYRDVVNPYLRANPDQNQLIFDLAQRLEHFTALSGERTLWHVEDSRGKIQGVALRTDPAHSLMLSQMDGDALSILVKAAADIEGLSDFVGANEIADGFADLWRKKGLKTLNVWMNLRLFSLEKVIPPRLAEGRMRQAKLSDLAVLSPWNRAFWLQADGKDMGAENAEKSMKKNITDGREYVWEDKAGDIVAMAVWTGKNEFGAKIAGVYTPEEKRGHGYASNLVAGVSETILREGAPKAFLFTDLSNPTSNSIYKRIGYQGVCDFRHFGIGEG